jgi:hypothetical protein
MFEKGKCQERPARVVAAFPRVEPLSQLESKREAELHSPLVRPHRIALYIAFSRRLSTQHTPQAVKA